MIRVGILLVVVAAPISSCAAPRFRDQPVVWRVDDARNIREPRKRPFHPLEYFGRLLTTRRLTRTLEFRAARPAMNTNALDEVPDSTWFTNRIGVRRMTPREAATGASAAGPPRLPLTIVAGKSAGHNPGFFVKDRLGRRFLIKFDDRSNPEMQTASSTIVNRIFWAAGYNVPNDTIFVFGRKDLRLRPKAKIEDHLKRKRPLTWKDVNAVLAQSPRLPDGRIRAAASEFLAGKPKGGIVTEGVRMDDPNDVIPHEHRRELRGLRVLAAWVNHTDMKEDNSIDMYVSEGGKRFLRHYLLDFGQALGAHAGSNGRLENGYENYWDWRRQPLALLTFGLWVRPWERLKPTRWLSIGHFGAAHFHPKSWREAYPYWPFEHMDAADAYWGAKIVMRFDRKLLEGVVAVGAYSDPAAARYLVDTLMARRDKVGRAFLEAVTPLDNLTVEGGQLCAVDLGLLYKLADHGVAQRVDRRGKVRWERTIGRDARVCTPLPTHDRYTVIRLRVVRGKGERPPMEIHVKGGKRARILGVIRVAQ